MFLVGAVPALSCVPDPDPTKRHQLMNCYDPAAFALPAQFTFGNASRNILRGPKFMSTDLSLMKTVPLAGGVRFQFRMECFNVFNNVRFDALFNQSSIDSSGSFGTYSTTLTSPRKMQFGLRFDF